VTDRTSDNRREGTGGKWWQPRPTPIRWGPGPSGGRSGSYTFKTVSIKGNQPKVSLFGEAALGAPPEDRQRMLESLMSGEEDVADYATGVCYDIVAFILALSGRIDRTTLLTTGGQDWLAHPAFDFDNGTVWGGEPFPEGSAVGFKRIGGREAGYFHAAVAVGGTCVRGVNAAGITFGWRDEADLTERTGRHTPDIEVRYLPAP
jgi:hypothetical protein